MNSYDVPDKFYFFLIFTFLFHKIIILCVFTSHYACHVHSWPSDIYFLGFFKTCLCNTIFSTSMLTWWARRYIISDTHVRFANTFPKLLKATKLQNKVRFKFLPSNGYRYSWQHGCWYLVKTVVSQHNT